LTKLRKAKILNPVALPEKLNRIAKTGQIIINISKKMKRTHFKQKENLFCVKTIKIYLKICRLKIFCWRKNKNVLQKITILIKLSRP